MTSEGIRSESPGIGVRTVPLTCTGHSRPVPFLSFGNVNSDGQYFLVSACKDGNPMMRDGLTGDWVGTFLGHKGAVWSIELSYDSSLAVTASADFTTRLWNTYTGEAIAVLNHDNIVRSAVFSPKANQIATGGSDKVLRLFDVQQISTLPKVLGTCSSAIKALVWAKEDCIVSSTDHVVEWWGLGSQKIFQKVECKDRITWCNESRGILTVNAGHDVYFYDVQDHRLLQKHMLKHKASCAAVDGQLKKFVTGSVDDTWVRIYDYDTGEENEVYKGHHGLVHAIAYSPDSKIYATGSEDGTVRLWKAAAGPVGLWR